MAQPNTAHAGPSNGAGPQPAAPAGPAGATATNGVLGDGPSNRVDVIDSDHGRILCVADLRGKLSQINELAKEHGAKAVIHSGDFGFYEPSSIERISDRTLRHLVQYSPLLTTPFRTQLLQPSTSISQLRALLTRPPPGSSTTPFPLSEFPELVSGKLRFSVPVYTVWGACEDVSVLERIRAAPPSPIAVPPAPLPPLPAAASSLATTTGPQPTADNYSIPNLTVLDEATTRVLVVGGVRLRLFGLGGAIVPHKLFDNGEGGATIAGGQGTMWTTVLQIGEMVDTAQRVFDPTETRLLVSHASPGREGLLAQLGLVLKADLSVSAGLHFRYGVSYNEFSVQHDQDTFRAKLQHARTSFNEIYDTVKDQVKAVIDDQQEILLGKALAVTNRVPNPPAPGGGAQQEESAWKNAWHWNLPDAAYGSLVLDVKDGRVGAEMRSQGFNFSYRAQQPPPQPQPQQPVSAPTQPRAALAGPTGRGTGSFGPPHQQQPPFRQPQQPNHVGPGPVPGAGRGKSPINHVGGAPSMGGKSAPFAAGPPTGGPGGPPQHRASPSQQTANFPNAPTGPAAQQGGRFGGPGGPQHRNQRSREDRRDPPNASSAAPETPPPVGRAIPAAPASELGAGIVGAPTASTPALNGTAPSPAPGPTPFPAGPGAGTREGDSESGQKSKRPQSAKKKRGGGPGGAGSGRSDAEKSGTDKEGPAPSTPGVGKGADLTDASGNESPAVASGNEGSGIRGSGGRGRGGRGGRGGFGEGRGFGRGGRGGRAGGRGGGPGGDGSPASTPATGAGGGAGGEGAPTVPASSPPPRGAGGGGRGRGFGQALAGAGIQTKAPGSSTNTGSAAAPSTTGPTAGASDPK